MLAFSDDMVSEEDPFSEGFVSAESDREVSEGTSSFASVSDMLFLVWFGLVC